MTWDPGIGEEGAVCLLSLHPHLALTHREGGEAAESHCFASYQCWSPRGEEEGLVELEGAEGGDTHPVRFFVFYSSLKYNEIHT